MDALILNQNLNKVLFPVEKKTRIIMHVLFWILFVLYHLIYFIPRSLEMPITSEMIQAYGLYYARYIPIFYSCILVYRILRNSFQAIPLLFFTLAASVIVMHIFTILMFLLADLLYGIEDTAVSFQMLGKQYLDSIDHFSKSDLLLSIYDLQDMQLLILPVGIKMIKFGIIQERNSQNLKTNQLKTQLANLRSQLSPHFVLNIINAAFAQILPVSEKAADYLAKISEILSFSLYETSQDSIPLKKEINCLAQLIELETIRTDIRASIRLEIKGTIKPLHTIPALLLVSLLENALKHSVHATYQKSEVIIKVRIRQNFLYFYIFNTKPAENTPKPNTQKNSGIGLSNISKRLELQFPGVHQFEIEQTADSFVVTLSLPLVPIS